MVYTVKPPIKDTRKEDTPPNKGHTKFTHSAGFCQDILSGGHFSIRGACI